MNLSHAYGPPQPYAVSESFQHPQFDENSVLMAPLDDLAAHLGCTRAQMALAWVLSRGNHVIVIPGTTKVTHLEENCGAEAIRLDAATLAQLDAVLPQGRASGARYPAATQVENDTEEIGQGT